MTRLHPTTAVVFADCSQHTRPVTAGIVSAGWTAVRRSLAAELAGQAPSLPASTGTVVAIGADPLDLADVAGLGRHHQTSGVESGDVEVSMQAPLPESPVTLWRQSAGPWWRLVLSAVCLAGNPSEQREVDVSENGFTERRMGNGSGSRFFEWTDIVDIQAVAPPDLAKIRLRSGESFVLDRWHLPQTGNGSEKEKRVELLRALLEESRNQRSDS